MKYFGGLGRNHSKSMCSILCFNNKEDHIIYLSKQSILCQSLLTIERTRLLMPDVFTVFLNKDDDDDEAN